MSITQISPQGYEPGAVYALENLQGIRLKLCTIGGAILEVETPDSKGMLKNIALCYKSIQERRASKSCAGATIGPAAGRLRDGILRLPHQRYQLTCNDGAHTLHGGNHGLAENFWAVEGCGTSSITFGCHLPDGLDGFPGDRYIQVAYTLDDCNCLHLDYTAKTHCPTFLNLTNHTYWNLTGDFSTHGYGQLLEIPANQVIYNDEAHLPSGTRSVEGTAFDFTTPRTLWQAMASDTQNLQLKNAQGYNNAYLLETTQDFAARLTDLESGRRVTLHTDYPSLVVYSGGYLPVPGCAIALEAQYPPDTCDPVLLPHQTYRHSISFTFDTVPTT